MNIAEKLTVVAENQPRVYDAGKKAEYDAFWDVFQKNGDTAGVPYNFAFSYGKFTDDNYNPKYPLYIKQGSSTADNMFYNSPSITDIKVPIYCKCSRLSNTFGLCSSLKTIPYLELLATTTFSGAFTNCKALENITIGGDIGQNGLSFENSSNLRT